MFSRLLRHLDMDMEWDYSGRMGRDEKQVNTWSINKKGKKEKILKDREEGGEVEKWRDKGGLPRAQTGLIKKDIQRAANPVKPKIEIPWSKNREK